MRRYHFVPPEPHGLIVRPRLWSEFGGSGVLTLVWGHRGSGKTAAVVEWVRHGPLVDNSMVVWLDGEKRAWERGEFWRRITQKLEDAQRGAQRFEPLLNVSDAEPVGRPSVQRMLTAIEQPVVLVIDGVRRFQPDLLADILSLSAAADSLRVVIVLDDQLQPESRRLLRSADIAGMGPTELAFTPQEIEELPGSGRLFPLRGYGDAVHRLISGDPLVTVALIRELEHMEAPIESAKLDLTRVRDIIGLDTIEAVPGATTLLRHLGLARHPSRQLLHRIAGHEDVADIIGQVEAAGLGAWSPVDGEPHFHLSPPAARLLADEVVLSTMATDRTLRIVHGWAVEHGDLVNALGAALDLGDEELVGAQIRGEIARITELSHTSMRYLLERTRGDTGLHSSWMSFLPALAYVHHVDLRDAAERALAHLLGMRRDAAGDGFERIVATYVETIGHRAGGDVAAALATATALVSTGPDAEGPAMREIMAQAMNERALVLTAAGDHDAARSILDRTIDEAPALAGRALFRARMLRGALDARDGNLRELSVLARVVNTHELRPSGSSDGASTVPFNVLGSWIALEELAVGGALQRLAHAEASADPVEFWTFVAEPLAFASHLSEQGAQAWDWVDRHELPAESTARWRLHQARSRALRDLARDDHERAISRFTDLEPCADVAIEQARVRLYAGQLVAARQHLDDAQTGGLTTHRLRSDYDALRAAIELHTGEDLDASGTATDPARKELSMFSLAMLPARERDILRSATGSATLGSTNAKHPRDRAQLVAKLTKLELEILKDLHRRYKLTQIASIRVVSINTIKSQLQGIYRKLGVSSRAEAVETALHLGLLVSSEQRAVDPG